MNKVDMIMTISNFGRDKNGKLTCTVTYQDGRVTKNTLYSSIKHLLIK